jgi:hypothetical protein
VLLHHLHVRQLGTGVGRHSVGSCHIQSGLLKSVFRKTESQLLTT